jgi:two-component system C4-dicarboxylate transport sensor histidine kinase DctB
MAGISGGLQLFRGSMLILLGIVAGTSLFLASYTYFKSIAIGEAQSRMLLYQSTLAAALNRFQHLPHIIAGDPLVLRALSGRGRDDLNERLAGFAAEADVDAIYLMDASGLTIASSNYQDELTFLDQNYGFRPYFQEAIAGRHGEFFAIGATTGRPGYFVAEAVYDEAETPLGVLAIKLDLSDLVEAWTAGGEAVFVANGDGIVVLSSNADWRYRTLERLSEERLAAILDDRQFGDEPLDPLDWSVETADLVTLNRERFLHVEAPVDRLGWQLHYLADEGRVRERAWFTLIVAAIIGSSLFAIVFYRRSERVQTALRTSRADQNQLRLANAKLADEIEERKAAERRLEQAQSDLAQASKLAALGQLSASVTHELGQPLAAMRNYLTAAEIDARPEATELAANLGRIVQRMESITKQLRFFASPGDQNLETFDLKDAVHAALTLVEHDVSAKEIALDLDLSPEPATIRGNRFRIEQVVVNLFRNAIAAMKDADRKRLTLKLQPTTDMVEVTVLDTGHGLAGATIETLREPFHSTRASGEGMGLGLAISAAILREHGGELLAADRDGGGAVFTLRIPRIQGGAAP